MYKALFAAISLMVVPGCWPNWPPCKDSSCNWGFVTSSVPNAGSVSTIASHAADDARAANGFVVYGEDAVHTCLTAFHEEFVNGDVETGSTYRSQLANFMCDCARGQSPEACPEL